MTGIEVHLDGQLIRTVEASGAQEVEAALATAYGLFRNRDAWLPPAVRITILRETARLMQEQRRTWRVVLRTRAASHWSITSRGGARDRWRAALRRAAALEAGHVVPMGLNSASAGRFAFTQHEPIGVVVAVSAFNHPLNLIVHQVGPAIAAGCPVIVKPATDTPLSCLRFVELLHAAGLPQEWCQALVIEAKS